MSDSARIWVLDHASSAATLERLGDARDVADKVGTDVGVLIVSSESIDARPLAEHGADEVVLLKAPDAAHAGPLTVAGQAQQWFAERSPRLVLTGGDAFGREVAARLAARLDAALYSPALQVRARDRGLEIAMLDSAGARMQLCLDDGQRPAIVTFRAGVAEAHPADPARTGRVTKLDCDVVPEPVVVCERRAPEPAGADICHLERLVAGGRGLGSKAGFDMLRRIAAQLGAGVAASRMAVDLGWIEHARQVGQTGRAVRPELYIACGISGASHHLDGMSESRHIVAINTDPQAPIFKVAHLALVADLHEVLASVERDLARELV
jgi:electron transfer flavoprotein alpha subunit